MSDQYLETEEERNFAHTTGRIGISRTSSSAGDENVVRGPRRPPYTFAEHAWALRQLRKKGITPTNATILEAIGKRREALASGNEPEAAASLPVVQVVEVPQPAVNSLAEPYDQLAEQGLFEREIIRQEEFLADAREWNHYLLARVDALMEEILDLQQRSGLLETEDENGNPPEEEAEVMVAPVDSSPVEDASATEPVPPPPSVDWEKLLRESEGQRQDLEAQLEELKVEHVLNQSLERVIEEQRLSLESSGQRIEALTRQLDEAGHLKVRAEQLHAELLEARSSLEAYRDHESGWRTNQSQQEALRARAEAELEKLRNALEQEQFELGRLRGENDHFARLLETERGRLHAEQSRSAALISQLNRQLDEEREIRRQQEKDHASEVEQLCFHFEQERLEYEAAQKESAKTISELNRQIEDLQQIVAAARASSIPAGRLQEAESKLEQSEIRAAAAHKALDDLRTESEARITRLEATVAELEKALAGEREFRESADFSAPPEEIQALRKNLRLQTEAAERHKTAIGLLQRKLQETENELVELRSRKTVEAPVASPAPTQAPAPVELAPSPIPSPVPEMPAKSRPRFLVPTAILLLVLGAGIFGFHYFEDIRSLLVPVTAEEPAEAAEAAPATTVTTSAPPASPAPAPPPNPANLLAEQATDSSPVRPALLPPVPARRSPSTDWNRANLPVAAFIDGLFNPAGQLDFQRLRRIWQESQRGNLAPRSMDDIIPPVYDGFDGVPSAARAGDADSQYQLGLRLLVDAFSGYHRGIDASDPLREAYQWMQKAAQAGNPDALYVGGQMRRLGIGGSEDADKGLAVINFAARSGQPDAQEFLGVEFLNLYFQTRLDEYARTSAANFRAAAEQGRPLGELLYGRMLAEGIGVPQDTPAGVQWLVKAYRNGKTEAVQYLQDAAAAGSDAAARALEQLGQQNNASPETAIEDPPGEIPVLGPQPLSAEADTLEAAAVPPAGAESPAPAEQSPANTSPATQDLPDNQPPRIPVDAEPVSSSSEEGTGESAPVLPTIGAADSSTRQSAFPPVLHEPHREFPAFVPGEVVNDQ